MEKYRQRKRVTPIFGRILRGGGEMKYKGLWIAILAFILIPNVLFAGIYKCVDGNGNTSFSVEPKPGCTLLQESADADRLALLIGNSNYSDGGNLPNPVNDVRAMKRALERLGFKVIKHENCTQREMKMAMDDFGSRLRGQDVGLFFYAGHGVQVSRYNYLVPVDAKLSSEKKVEYNCVRADRVLAEMESAGSRTNIVILDACRDNPFTRSWRRGTQGAGLAFMNAPSGSLIAYSTAPGKTALDGGGKNSPYTSALLQHIDIPNTTIIEMFQGVRSTVIAQSEGKQTPWESTSLRKNFYFVKGGRDNYSSKGQSRELPEIEAPDIVKMYEKAKNINMEGGEYVEAVSLLNKAISLDPNYADAYKERGAAYMALNQNDKAIEDFKKVIEIRPKDADAYIRIGNVYDYNLEFYAKAIEEYSKAIKLEPSNVDAYEVRGHAYASLAKFKNAIKDYDKVIDIAPEDAFAYNSRGHAYAALNKHSNAIRDYSMAIGLLLNKFPGLSTIPYFARGNMYLELKEYGKALKDFDKVIELKENYEDAYYQRGVSYAYLSQHTKAIKDLDKAIELDPYFARAYAVRGLVYTTKLNNTKTQGCADLRRACELGACDEFNWAKEEGFCQ
jgi:tetratricopeptide (TPR) repeat protein